MPEYITPAITALCPNGEIDAAANKALWEHLIRGGVDGIVILGSIGEFFALPRQRRDELVRLACEHIAGRTKLYVGSNCPTVEETVEFSNASLRAGADGVMIITPYFFQLPDALVERYYDLIVPNIEGDVFLYSFPDRTGYEISPQVTLRLRRKYQNIAGYKDSVGGVGHTRELIGLLCGEFPDFKLYSGFDENFVHNVSCGGAGCIGGMSNIYPGLCSAWVKAVREADFARTTSIQRIIDRLMAVYTISTPFIPTIKKAVQLRGLPILDWCTAPMEPLDEQGTERVRAMLGDAQKMMDACGISY